MAFFITRALPTIHVSFCTSFSTRLSAFTPTCHHHVQLFSTDVKKKKKEGDFRSKPIKHSKERVEEPKEKKIKTEDEIQARKNESAKRAALKEEQRKKMIERSKLLKQQQEEKRQHSALKKTKLQQEKMDKEQAAIKAIEPTPEELRRAQLENDSDQDKKKKRKDT